MTRTLFTMLKLDAALMANRIAIFAMMTPLFMCVVAFDAGGDGGGVTRGLPVLAFMAVFLPIASVFPSEEKKRTNLLYLSLPFPRRTVLRARYVSMWMWTAIFFAYVVLLEALFGLVTGWGVPELALLGRAPLVVSLVLTLGFNVFIPFIYRFGWKKVNGIGGMLAGIGILALFIAFGKEVVALQSAHRALCAVAGYSAVAAGSVVSYRLSEKYFEESDV